MFLSRKMYVSPAGGSGAAMAEPGFAAGSRGESPGPIRQVHTAAISPIISLSLAISHRLALYQILYHSNDTQIGSCVTGDRYA